jgi:hypothetical protein
VSTQTVAGSTPTTSPAEYVGAILADVNGDGRPDLVTWRDTNSTTPEKGVFQVALGEVGGGFGAASTYQASNTVVKIVAGDWNSDGFQDLYVSASYSTTCVEIWLGHADGKLTPAQDTGIDGCLDSRAFRDLNGDGRVDLVTVGGDGEPVVYLADANGDFHVGTSYPAKHGMSGLVVQDWNGDGFPDLLFLSQVLSVYLNRGNGTFEAEMDCGVATPDPKLVVIADFNRDGHVDVAVGIGNSIGVLLGMGGCQFQPTMEYPLTERVDALSSGDVNGDGLEDLVAKTDDGKISLLLGAPDGTFQVVTLSVGSTPGYGEDGTLIVGDVTGDGKADIVVVPGTGTGVTQILENSCP